MIALVVFVIAGLVTYLTRVSFILLVGDRPLPDWGERVVRNVGGPVLAALTTSLLFSPDARLFLTSPARISAVFVAILLALRTRSFMWSFFGGMAVFWAIQAIVG